MENLITKQLLSKVLDLGLDYVSHKLIDNQIKYKFESKDEQYGFLLEEEINIYELANKCKEWAKKKNYTVIDYIDINNDEFWTCRAYPNGLNDGFDYEAIYQPLSPISIFDVCQWILEND